MKHRSKTLKPKLRFPEFRERPGWNEAKLDDVVTTVTPPAKLQTSTYLRAGRFPIIDQSRDFICGWTDDADAVISESLPLIIFGDHTCALKLVQQPFAQGADGIKILKVNATISTGFLFHSLSHQPLVMEDYKRHFSTLKERQVFYPEIESGEQQKIAECLTTLDELTGAEGWKLEALRAHKKGLLQQLFPREGETRPRLRFPEFRDKPEWKETLLSSIGDVITGSTPPTSRKEYYGGKHLFVSPADICELRFVESTKTTLTDSGFAQCRPVKAGSVLFVCIGSTIGKAAQNARDCATNQQINSVVPNSAFSGDFIYYLLLTESERIGELAGKQAVPIINKTLFSSVELLAPMLSEQERIASCLSSIDALIAAQSQKLDGLLTHKKGLMQQLFPSPKGVER